MKRALLLLIALLGFALSSAAWAEDNDDPGKAGSGLPLPRFASLRVDEVNLRTGPGTRYPIDWVYMREGLPVEITAEFDIWRRIRDWEGTEGWVHKSALTGKRTAIVTGEDTRPLLDGKASSAGVIASVDGGAIGQVLACDASWCHMKFSGHKGYMPKAALWGVYPAETIE